MGTIFNYIAYIEGTADTGQAHLNML